ncbi:MAG: hypothetical protein PVH41_11225 [Anaerolineae bacterium]
MDRSTEESRPGVDGYEREILRDLGEQHAERTRSVENYILSYLATFRLIRLLGVDPLSTRGRLTCLVLWLVTLLGLPAIIALLAGQLVAEDLLRWLFVAATYGVAGVVSHEALSRHIGQRVSLHRTMTDKSGLRRLIDWDRRWNNIRTLGAGAGAFAMIALVFFFVAQPKSHTAPSIGSVVVAFLIFYQVGEAAFSNLLIWAESHLLVQHEYDLYRLSPIDTPAVRQSVRGCDSVGLLIALLLTIAIIEFAVLLPGQSGLRVRIALFLLIITYVSVVVRVLAPRLAIRRIIQAHKERGLLPIRGRLNDLSARLLDLTDQEFAELERLKQMHDAINGSSENVLTLGSLAHLTGALLVPTASFLLTVVGETYLRRLVESSLP